MTWEERMQFGPIGSLIPAFISEQFAQNRRAGHMRAVVLFVDISGFTPLTESLMGHLTGGSHQKGGAEALSDVVMAIFDPMVSQVAACGGIIPLFAGDAFAAIFPQADDQLDRSMAQMAAARALQVVDFIQRYFSDAANGLRGVRTFQTPYGDFAIGVKVGLAFGDVAWGIPGGNGRYTYYFRGPAITQAVCAQALAASGDAVADPSMLPLIQGQAQIRPLGETDNVCVIPRQRARPFTAPPLPKFSLDDIRPFLSSLEWLWHTQAEFRQATPVFIAFTPPDETERLHEFVTAVLQLAETYGGDFSQVDFSIPGGYLVIWFGLPSSYENNTDRALSFLLALKQTFGPDSGPTAVPWRAGVANGVVWAGLRGGKARCEYGAIGDVVNIAARLAMRAPDYDIWTTHAVYITGQSAFSFADFGQIPLKGKRHQLAVYRVLQPKRPTTGLQLDRHFWGRAKEMQRLQEFVKPIFNSQFAGVFYLDGEAGIGKSYLLAEFSRHIRRAQSVFVANCPSDEVLQTSLNPFRAFLADYFLQQPANSFAQNKQKFDQTLDLLSHRLQMEGETAVAIHQELWRSRSFLAALLNLEWPDSLYAALEPKLRFENTRLALKNFLKAISLIQPVILVLKNAHWLDLDSQQILPYLLREMADYPLAVLVEGRYGTGGAAIRLELGPEVPTAEVGLDYLSVYEVGLMAAQIIEGELAPTAVHFIHQKTNGNPLFIEHLVLSMCEQRMLLIDEVSGEYNLSQTAVDSVPETLQAVLISRLDRLSPEVRRLAQVAAVLGPVFDVPVLAAMAPQTGMAPQTVMVQPAAIAPQTAMAPPVERSLPEQLAEAELAQIWTAVAPNRYAFSHALLRDAAYHMQLPSRLSYLHGQTAVALETVYAANLSPRYADLAYHWRRAKNDAKEYHYVILAGRDAEANYANHQAVDYYSRALELLPTDQDTMRHTLNLAREHLYDLLGERERQFEDLSSMAEQLPPLGNLYQRAELALRLSRFAEVTGDYSAVKGAVQIALSLAQQAADPVLEANCYQQLGNIFYRLDEYKQAVLITRRALKLAQQLEARDIEAKCLRVLASVAWKHSHFARASTFLRKALALDRAAGIRIGEGETLNKLGLVAENSHHYETAVNYYAQALAIFRMTGDRWSQSIALGNLGYLYARVGLYELGRAHFEQDLAICREIDDRRGQCWTTGNLSLLYSRVGDFRQGWQLALQALSLADSLKNESLRGYALGYLGRAYTGLGQWDRATAVYQQSLAIRRKAHDQFLVLEALANLAYLAMLQGDLAAAQNWLTGVLVYSQNETIDRVEEPVRLYWICFQVLQAAGHPDAGEILQETFGRIQKLSAGIKSPEWREAFLNGIDVHREIILWWRDGSPVAQNSRSYGRNNTLRTPG